jgi:hypothetical protein
MWGEDLLSCHDLLEMCHRSDNQGSKLCEGAEGAAGEDRDCDGGCEHGAASSQMSGGVRNGGTWLMKGESEVAGRGHSMGGWHYHRNERECRGRREGVCVGDAGKGGGRDFGGRGMRGCDRGNRRKRGRALLGGEKGKEWNVSPESESYNESDMEDVPK